jgi:hypothetical protein
MGFAGRQQKKCVWLIFRQPSMTGTEACPDRHGGLSYWLFAVSPGGSGVSVCELGDFPAAEHDRHGGLSY